MALNTLRIDPHRIWKGAWRWWSEDLLEGIDVKSVDDKGICLEEFGNLARRNGAAFLEFYYDATRTSHRIGEKRFARPETFRYCLLASSRRTGLYLILNQSRQALGQTGTGHYMPVGGVNLSRQQALCFDVARYKYPPYWCSVPLLYDSIKLKDSSSGLSRGFGLIARQPEGPCLLGSRDVSEDTKSREGVQLYFQRSAGFANLEELVSGLPEDFMVIVVYFLFELVEYLAREQNSEVRSLLGEQLEEFS